MDDTARGGTQGKQEVAKDPEHTYADDELADYKPAPYEEESKSAFRIGKGKWYHAAGHLATTIATPAAYAPLPFAISRLTWPGGLIALAFAGLTTMYTSCLLASLDRHDGIRRTRYRDLAASIMGPLGYWSTVVFQQVASIGNNITIQIVAGQSMWEIYLQYKGEDASGVTLQEFIIIFGAFELLLSQLPDIHSLRVVNLLCTGCTIAFTACVVGLSAKYGHDRPRSEVDYGNHGSPALKIFSAFFAMGTVTFAFGDTILPEIQATCHEPAKTVMYKGIFGGYGVLLTSYFLVTILGYWAFGFDVATYIVFSFDKGPGWVITMTNIFAVLQVVGCYQIYSRPTFEYVYVQALDPKKGPWAARNAICRAIVTTVYVVLITFICCLIPFFGDFVALVGAIGFTPMDFILPIVLYMVCRKPKGWFFVFNAALVSFWTLASVLGAVGSFRFIIQDSINYSVFANEVVSGG